ncbi:hypothetical protein VTK26DRAFT_7052 [Humicola hyalothermophila]
MGFVLPTQGPLSQPTPVTMSILSCCDILATAAAADECAASQAAVPVGAARGTLSGAASTPASSAAASTARLERAMVGEEERESYQHGSGQSRGLRWPCFLLATRKSTAGPVGFGRCSRRYLQLVRCRSRSLAMTASYNEHIMRTLESPYCPDHARRNSVRLLHCPRSSIFHRILQNSGQGYIRDLGAETWWVLRHGKIFSRGLNDAPWDAGLGSALVTLWVTSDAE